MDPTKVCPFKKNPAMLKKEKRNEDQNTHCLIISIQQSMWPFVSIQDHVKLHTLTRSPSGQNALLLTFENISFIFIPPD